MTGFEFLLIATTAVVVFVLGFSAGYIRCEYDAKKDTQDTPTA